LVLKQFPGDSPPASGLQAGYRGEIEILLLEENGPLDWWVMLRPGKRVRRGTKITFRTPDGQVSPLQAEVLAKNEEGHCRLRFAGVADFSAALMALVRCRCRPTSAAVQPATGAEDRSRYQTVFARHGRLGGGPDRRPALPPTNCWRHCGPGASGWSCHPARRPWDVRAGEGRARRRACHARGTLRGSTRNRRRREPRQGKRAVASSPWATTSVRVLESVAREHRGQLVAGSGRTRIFLHPPAMFSIVDALLTNFHLPQSTLLMLVSAFVAPGEHPPRPRPAAGRLCRTIRERYRFFSYGDAMLIL